MEKTLYEATEVKYDSSADRKEIKVKLRLLDGHFYDNVFFKGSLKELIKLIEKGEMLYIVKFNGDKIFLNSRLVLDFVLSTE